MIDIGSTNFLIGVPSLPPDEFELYSTKLFDEWDLAIERGLTLPDYSISLEIEEGSIKGAARIGVTLTALYIGIAQYGSFISGLKIIGEQISYVNSALFENAKAPFTCDERLTTSRKNGGTLSRLHRLFSKVQNGAMTPDQAILEAVKLLGQEADENPKFIQELKSSLENAPLDPVQLRLIDDNPIECIESKILTPNKPTRLPRPKPDKIPIPQHYKVEIWRTSKKDKKQIKVTKQ